MKTFGGEWTRIKMDIVLKYTKAYLQIMKNRPWKLMYFDGFAGSGEIENEAYSGEGVASQILKINDPVSFDMYYFVEMNKKSAEALEKKIKLDFPGKKNAHVVKEDCNRKLHDLSRFLKEEGSVYKVLAFIDPFGMSIKWDSLEDLKGLGIDLWILIPTGVGPNRLLKRNGDIPDIWWNKLESFLGLPKTEIKRRFYKKSEQMNLFGLDEFEKEKDSIERLHKIYREQLGKVFRFVSDSFVLKNKRNSILFHFLLASNNANAVKIGNDIVAKYKL